MITTDTATNAQLAKHLLRSPHVRAALKKELWRLLVFVAIYVGVTAASRYFREKPIYEGVLSAAFGAAGVALLWLISAIRTVRAALREHSLLEP
jgi:hypothetical protein